MRETNSHRRGVLTSIPLEELRRTQLTASPLHPKPGNRGGGDRNPKPGHRKPKTETRTPKTENRNPDTENRNPKPGHRKPKTETRKHTSVDEESMARKERELTDVFAKMELVRELSTLDVFVKMERLREKLETIKGVQMKMSATMDTMLRSWSIED
ncbi:hypothetical protein T484DRAFT_1896667 [Baffinella frigidus]|nr:hypothetical protein T484DRAFT_1896667 [Cryptophyta sp. CCMP2293]